MISSYANIFNLCLRIENSIYIDAPLSMVWSVSEDIERWPEWTPTVTTAQLLGTGRFGPGSKVRIKQPSQPESDWIVTEYVPGKLFAWESRRLGLKMTATHLLSRNESGTLNTLRAEVSGILAVVFWPVLRFAIPRALQQENHGLKTRCESLLSTNGRTVQGSDQ